MNVARTSLISVAALAVLGIAAPAAAEDGVITWTTVSTTQIISSKRVKPRSLFGTLISPTPCRW